MLKDGYADYKHQSNWPFSVSGYVSFWRWCRHTSVLYFKTKASSICHVL